MKDEEKKGTLGYREDYFFENKETLDEIVMSIFNSGLDNTIIRTQDRDCVNKGSVRLDTSKSTKTTLVKAIKKWRESSEGQRQL